MKKISILLFALSLVTIIAGCSEKTESVNSQQKELDIFVNAYNEAVKTLNSNTEKNFDSLVQKDFKPLEKTKDGFGYIKVLDQRKDHKTTSLYQLECLYDNNKNIIGYQSFGIGKLENKNEDGTINFPEKGIGSGYVIAKALFNDTDNFNDHYLKLMDNSYGEVSYEENDYKISMETDAEIGAITFKFMKTK